MEAKTSSQAYQEYLGCLRIEEKLEKGNRGCNLLNASKFKEKFFISIKKLGKRTLIDSRDWLVVNSNLPFADSWRYNYGEVDVEEFLKQLEKWVLIPKFSFFLSHNRKRDNQVSSWELPSFRKKNIEVSEIEFRIGKKAEHEIKLKGFDIVGTIKNILSKQRDSTNQESLDFERFKLLIENIDNLERQLPTSSNYYGYGSKKDDTLKITIDKKTYNKNLKIIDEELLKLCKKYPYLKMPDIDYQDIKKRLSFEDWELHNKEEAEEDWSDLEDEEKDDYDGDFDCYLQKGYESYLEYNDFDE